MLGQRRMMRNRVSSHFRRSFQSCPGMSGDTFTPAFWPAWLTPGISGAPWAKEHDSLKHVLAALFIVTPFVGYHWWFGWWRTTVHHITPPQIPAPWGQWVVSAYNDLEDPDYWIKREKFKEEIDNGELSTFWGGTNWLSGYNWEPGDPMPDKRRRMPPGGHLH